LEKGWLRASPYVFGFPIVFRPFFDSGGVEAGGVGFGGVEADCQICRNARMPYCRIARLQECRIAGFEFQDYPNAGLPDCRIAGMLDCRI
jgi:hypothetical protein